ncbi:hypothetical protein K4A83_06825 [Spirulina subsalsa FACHB-351]|uniref:Uncharacterized protein n=1 Tax=Spirulina subsalsa FACHB-351 TaxID=234711 RepID=A0ABT3L3D4_9CYAN|nr:hypothetical protein [Spirulina subsalsa]MCW6035985.1 hypothetical protein [Spirulina subsalsa FACHB-351]
MFSSEEAPENRCYLGLEIDTLGISAVLQKVGTGEQYHLYWSARNGSSDSRTLSVLPLMAYFSPKVKPTGKSRLSMVVGEMAAEVAKPGEGTLVQQFKPLLNVAVPYYSRKQRQWEPKVYGDLGQSISLYWVQRALQSLLSSLTPAGVKHLYRVGAKGLSGEVLGEMLSNVVAVVVNCPATWGDSYRFNVREVILGAKVVERPDQVIFVEDAIAVLLAHWSQVCQDRQEVHQERLEDPRPYSPDLAPSSTLILQGGITTLELGLVDLPDDLNDLSYRDFTLTSLDYGLQGLYEDIFYQLIYPQWQPEQAFLADLQFEAPQGGTPDHPKRDQALLQVLSFSEGRSLLEMARRVWLILQKQESFSTFLGEQTWGVQRADLIEQILTPFTKQLNQQINLLLSHRDYQEDGLQHPGTKISQILYSGDFFTPLWPFLEPWLRQKFPQARFIQGLHPPDTRPVALGLAQLPQYPQLFDRLRHQYSDFFLLSELLHTFPQKPITLERMLQALEQRGINPKACMWRVLAILEGKLPSGLVPTAHHLLWLTPESQQTLEYQAVMAAPLFRPDGQGNYIPNYQQGRRLRQYLSLVLAGTQQKLADPLSIFLV